MSHPNPAADYSDPKPNVSSHQKALSKKIKGFGSEHPGTKGIKKLLKKSISHRIKHF